MLGPQRIFALLVALPVASAIACVASENDRLTGASLIAPTASPSPSADARVEGVVAGLGGSCPNLTFGVNGQSVVTNAATRFEHAACSDLSNGMRVEVEGVRQASGPIAASKVERKDVQVVEVELKGSVTGLAGACPSVSFTINGQRVVTNAATQFDKISCGGLTNGLRVEAKGIRQTDGTVVASKVERED